MKKAFLTALAILLLGLILPQHFTMPPSNIPTSRDLLIVASGLETVLAGI